MSFLPRVRSLAAVVTLLSVLPASAAAQTIFNPGDTYVQAWNVDYASAYGQTFTAANEYLNSFSFWLDAYDNLPVDLLFQAHVYAFDPSLGRITGPALFESALLGFATAPEDPAVQVAIETGDLQLAPGQLYAAFLTTGPGLGTGRTRWAFALPSNYEGGRMIWNHNSDWAGTQWAQTTGDLQFEMTFSGSPQTVVPEPISMVLLGTGLAGVGGAWRRRRRTADA